MPSSRDEYSAAEVELQRLRDLKPGVPSLTRASYSFELHGRQADAVAVLQRAASIAAASQYAIVRAEEKLFAAGGNSDLEVALFDADHGRPVEALSGSEVGVGPPQEHPGGRRLCLGPTREWPRP